MPHAFISGPHTNAWCTLRPQLGDAHSQAGYNIDANIVLLSGLSTRTARSLSLSLSRLKPSSLASWFAYFLSGRHPAPHTATVPSSFTGRLKYRCFSRNGSSARGDEFRRPGSIRGQRFTGIDGGTSPHLDLSVPKLPTHKRTATQRRNQRTATAHGLCFNPTIRLQPTNSGRARYNNNQLFSSRAPGSNLICCCCIGLPAYSRSLIGASLRREPILQDYTQARNFTTAPVAKVHLRSRS